MITKYKFVSEFVFVFVYAKKKINHFYHVFITLLSNFNIQFYKFVVSKYKN